ncbi:hypothetical protein V2J09_024291 [Rumex salicifolius]
MIRLDIEISHVSGLQQWGLIASAQNSLPSRFSASPIFLSHQVQALTIVFHAEPKQRRSITTRSGVMDVNLDWPVIIAMQGDPYTGKTTLANALADKLKCLVIRLDEVLDAISANEPNPPTPQQAEALISQSFNIITQIVKTHTSFRHSVVIDSPLSRRSHLDSLVGLLPESRERGRLRLIIIECKPQIEYAWQMRFEERDSTTFLNKWYKPQNNDWPLDKKINRDFTDDDIHPIVSKLVVNTTDHVPLESLYNAVDNLTTDSEGCKADLEEWMRIGDFTGIHLEGKRELNRLVFDYCTKGHLIREYWEEGIVYESTCGVCNDRVTEEGQAYTCSSCPLAIHKSCAELGGMEFTPNNFPKFLNRDGFPPSYCFPEEHVCCSCRDTGKSFSNQCTSCIFQCHMKCRLLPTILNHHSHEHKLFFWLDTYKWDEYLCTACRRTGDYSGYRCTESCKGEYHPECALLPRVLPQHKHGGHIHDLEMITCRDEELEDYLCDVCQEKTNPEAWYYSCNKCHLSLHLDCAYKDFDA